MPHVQPATSTLPIHVLHSRYIHSTEADCVQYMTVGMFSHLFYTDAFIPHSTMVSILSMLTSFRLLIHSYTFIHSTLMHSIEWHLCLSGAHSMIQMIRLIHSWCHSITIPTITVDTIHFSNHSLHHSSGIHSNSYTPFLPFLSFHFIVDGRTFSFLWVCSFECSCLSAILLRLLEPFFIHSGWVGCTRLQTTGLLHSPELSNLDTVFHVWEITF